MADEHHYIDGIWVFDITEPYAPQLMTYYDEYGYFDVFYYDGLIYAIRNPDRLDIFQFSSPAEIEEHDNLPESKQILATYPNPFNSSTTINYNLTETGMVTLTLYNIQGQRIAEIVHGIREAGEHSITWHASDYPSGVYFARLESGGSSKTVKMVLLK